MTDRVNVSSGSSYEPAVGYSRAVRVGGHMVVAGTTGQGENMADRTRDALRHIEISLHETGAALSGVVRTTIYVTDIGR